MIVTQPQSQTVTAGSTVTFSVTATGTEPLAYSWRRNNLPISGATNASLTLVNVQTNQTGLYRVVVTNIAGAVISSNAFLQVIPGTNQPPVPPTILTQPQSQTVLVGADVSFSVEATGTEPLGYRWRHNNLIIPGATGPTLTLLNVQATNAGNYSVLVTNVAGLRVSSNAVLQVLLPTNIPPTVTLTGPTEGATFVAPATIVLNAIASDLGGTVARVEFFAGPNKVAQDLTAPYSQVWSNVPPGNYQLTAVATDNSNAVTVSTPVNITVADSSGALALIPAGAVWKYLDDGSDQGSGWTGPAFDDSPWAAGPARLGYGIGDEATVVSFGPDPANKYITTYFRRAFSVANSASITGLTVRLLRDDGGVVYLNGVEVFRSNMPGGPISFNTLAAASVNETNYLAAPVPSGLLVAGQNVVAVEIHQASPASSDLSFDLELIGQTSAPTNRVAPRIVTQPQSQTVTVGSNVTFNVVATGTPPLIYRWRRDGTTIAVTTNGILALFNVQTNQSGFYSVVVSNLVGSATSSNALLQVINPIPPNQPPIAIASVSPLTTLFPDQTNLFVISPNNSNALVVLDASLSSDPDNNPLEFAWLEEATVIATGVLTTNELEIGVHGVTLAVDDGTVASTDTVVFEVITAGDAVDEISARVENSTLPRWIRRPLAATLASTKSALDAGNFDAGVHRLQTFQSKVELRVTPIDPDLAGLLMGAAQGIIDAVGAP